MVFHRENTAWGKSSIIVLAGGNAIVTVSIRSEEPYIALVHDLVVHKTVRRKGLGNALLDMAENEASHMGAMLVRVNVEPGTWQVKWYERHGYMELDRVDFEGHEFIVMEKGI